MLAISDKTKTKLVKSAIAGTILSVASGVLYGNASVDIAGTSVPAMIPVFVAGAGASLATDLIESQLNLPTVSAQKLADISSLAIASGISGAAAVAILKVSTGLPQESILPVFGLAAGAQAGSEYITMKFLQDSTGHLIF
jgi:hypothetical protein